MALENTYTDMAAAIKLIRNNEPELAAYLADPQTTCTFFMPTAEVSSSKGRQVALPSAHNDSQLLCLLLVPPVVVQALQNSIRWLGKYAGKAAQNATLTRSTLNYHVLPGEVLTAEEVGKKHTKSLTRAGETLFMWREK